MVKGHSPTDGGVVLINAPGTSAVTPVITAISPNTTETVCKKTAEEKAGEEEKMAEKSKEKQL